MNVNSCSYIYSEAERFRQKLWNDLNNVNFSDAFVELDNICDYIPVISTISNLVDLFQKYVIHPFFSGEVKDRYWSHIEQKDLPRQLYLLMPYYGVPQYDFDKANQPIIKRKLEHLHNETLYVLNEVDDYLLKFIPNKIKEIDATIHKVNKMKADLDALIKENKADMLSGTVLNDDLEIKLLMQETYLMCLTTELLTQKINLQQADTYILAKKTILTKLEANTKDFIKSNSKSALAKGTVNTYITGNLDLLESITSTLNEQKEFDQFNLFNLETKIIETVELFFRKQNS